jgi:hypothetical protein
MSEIVVEREFKLRQALQAMGLHDLAYWLSWHFYQSVMTMLFSFFIWVFGMMFQFKMFHKNGELKLTQFERSQSLVESYQENYSVRFRGQF